MKKFINFNNAGASFPFLKVNKTIVNYLREEEKFGGYYCAEIYKKKLKGFYFNLSKLINSQEKEISFVPNSTYGWNLFFNSLNLRNRDNVIICDNEYGSNYISIKKSKINFNKTFIDQNGQVSVDDLGKRINKNTKVVFLCHIASQNGNIICIEKVGNFLRKRFPKILFVVDACQSIGQVDVDVKKIKCHALVGSGRKYLRGPRGTGFIFVKSDIQKKIVPFLLDMHNARVDDNEIINKKKHIFETFEYSPAMKIAFSESIASINRVGIIKLQNKIRGLSLYLRKKLLNKKSVKFFENQNYLSGINTLIIKNFDVNKIYSYLLEKKVLTSISTKQTSIDYFKKLNINKVLRVSFHYYNTYKEIDYFCECISNFVDVHS